MFHQQANTSHTHSNCQYPAVRLKRTWVIAIKGDRASLIERPVMKSFSFLPSFPSTSKDMDAGRFSRYLESALKAGKFDTLMLVGEPEDLQRFRHMLPEMVCRHIVGEVQRPNQNSEFLTERLQEMCA